MPSKLFYYQIPPISSVRLSCMMMVHAPETCVSLELFVTLSVESFTAGTLVTWLEQKLRNGCSSPATQVALSSSELAQVKRTPSLSRSETARALNTTVLEDWMMGDTLLQADALFKHLG